MSTEVTDPRRSNRRIERHRRRRIVIGDRVGVNRNGA
jgi:hypothetical protein